MAAILDFPLARFYLFLIYKSPWWSLASLESTGLSVQEKRKIDFQDGGHLGFPIGTILAIFWSTSHPDASYQVSSQLAHRCRRSRLLKQLLTPQDGHWLTTIVHHEHFVLRWAKNNKSTPYKFYYLLPCRVLNSMWSLTVSRMQPLTERTDCNEILHSEWSFMDLLNFVNHPQLQIRPFFQLNTDILFISPCKYIFWVLIRSASSMYF